MKIFISHSSLDKTIIDVFVEKILILGCGLKDEEIFCTSIEGLGIKTGLDFRNHIRENLMSSDYSLLMISDNYQQSDICLNEMGASWAQNTVEVRPFIFPEINFNSIGSLYSVKHVARLDNSTSLDELYEEFSERLPSKIPVSRWNKNKADFLNFQIKYKTEASGNTEPPLEFFDQFIQENVVPNHIIEKCHPTLLDCKKIFNAKYYVPFFKYFCHAFETNSSQQMQPFYPESRFIKTYKTKAIDLLFAEKNLNIAGGMIDLGQKGVFNSGIDFYSVKISNSENQKLANIAFSVFCYINGRWVFLPKPWRIGNLDLIK